MLKVTEKDCFKSALPSRSSGEHIYLGRKTLGKCRTDKTMPQLNLTATRYFDCAFILSVRWKIALHQKQVEE